MNYLKQSNSIIINLIIVSIVPFLILGPFFPDLIVSVSGLFFLFYVFKNKKFYFFNNKPFIIFFVFCIYCILLSLFKAEDKILSFQSSFFYFRIGVFSCLIWYLVNKDRKILNYFYYTLVFCFLALLIDGYIQSFTGINLSLYKIGYEVQRVSSFFGDEGILGSYLSRLFPILFALFCIRKKKKYEIFFMIFLFILTYVLVFKTGERAAFFLLNIAVIFIVILIKSYQKFRLVTFIMAIICVFILSLNFSNLKNRMFDDLTKNRIYNESLKKIVFFTPAHDSLFRTAYNMFKDSPIFGHGPKMFRIICKDSKYATGSHPCSTHPHNFYLQLLAETGIIGFLFLTSAFMYVVLAAMRQIKSIILNQKRTLTDYQVSLLAAILITVWPITSNGNFFNNWLMIVYCLPVGLYLQSVYSKK